MDGRWRPAKRLYLTDITGRFKLRPALPDLLQAREDKLKNLIHHPLAGPLIILVLGTLAYANSFGVPFVLDDLDSITGNAAIRDLGNFLPGGSDYEIHLRRWVAYFSFALNYRFGGLSVFGYHLFNLALHLGTALLVYLLVRLTFRTPYFQDSAAGEPPGRPYAATFVPLVAALFFVVHPVQTQAVTYVVQRLTSLCTLFYLLSVVLYVQARVGMEARGTRLQPSSILLLAGSVLAAILAMFTKEIAFTLPLAALLYEFCFFRGAWRPRLLPLLPLLVTLPIIPLMVFTSGEMSSTGTFLQTRIDIPRGHYLLTQFPVIVTYLRLLFLPMNQNLDYDYPVYTTFFTPPVFLSFLLVAALLALALYLWASSRREPSASRLLSFGLFWFFLTLSVESSIVPLADVIFEHRLYLPSVGLAAALAGATLLATQKTASLLGGRLPLLAAAVAILVLSVATWQRNQVWQSEVSLWADTVRKSPGKARPWYNLGTYLKDTGQPTEAIPALSRAVEIDPKHVDAWHNLGLAYLMTGRELEAVSALRRAVRLDPEFDNAAINLSAALLQTGQYAQAVPLLERVRNRTPAWAEVRFNLGLAYAGSGNLPGARRELADLQRLNPTLARGLADIIQGEP